MSAEQLCFFKFARPLVDLLGVPFFRSIPPQPGVYIFYGDRRRVLYVGQSKNLRLRLAYYKNAQPERGPRRIIRMVHQTRALEFEICATPEEAALRELELIQEHQPRFNVQHALSRTYSFFGIRTLDSEVRLRLTLESQPLENEIFLGAFKNRGLCRRALFAIARTAWFATRRVESLYTVPLWLLDRTKLNELSLGQPADTYALQTLLKGESDSFLRQAEENWAQSTDPFVKALLQIDLLSLAEFYVLAGRMKSLRASAGLDSLTQRAVDRIQLTASQSRKVENCRCGGANYPVAAPSPFQ